MVEQLSFSNECLLKLLDGLNGNGADSLGVCRDRLSD